MGGRAVASVGLVTLLAAGLLSTAAAPPPAGPSAHRALEAAGLTEVGALPGPALLVAAPPTDPGTAPRGRWRLPATGVSGTTVLGEGELVHTGWPFDDHGPDTIPLPLLPILVGGEPAVTDSLFSSRTGDLVYPTDRGRFAANAADLVELRVRPDADGLVVRTTWNTLTEPGVPVVAIGIDTDGDDAATDWGRGLGVLGPTGVDHVLATDGVVADVDGTPVPTSTDLASGTVEVLVPTEVLPFADDAVLELFAVAGISDGDGGFVPAGPAATGTTPGGDPTGSAPPAFDVAFRAGDQEPAGLFEPTALSAQSGTYGSWRSHAAALALAARDISAFSAELDLAAVRGGATASDVPTSGTFQRTYWSRFDLGAGLGPTRPIFRANRQPYTIHVPSCVERGEVPVLTLALHSLLGNHGQYLAASPGFYEQLGEDRCSIVVTTLGRGPDGWYLDEAEADLFEVLADVLATYEVDLGHTLVHGYSMGGYGTYRLAGRYPDLFAATFPVVGPPFEGAVLLAGSDDGGGEIGFAPASGQVDPTTDTSPLLDSMRHVPMLAWHGAADELVPITSAITHLQRLEANGYRYRQEIFAADHLMLAVLDRWERATEVLGERPAVVRDPAHVTFRAMPARDRPDLGLVADHAYWVSDVRAHDGAPISGGLLDVRTFATGAGDPITAPILEPGDAPLPYVARGVSWTEVGDVAPRPAVEADLTDIASATLDLTDGRLPITGDADATVTVATDGPATLALRLERDDVTVDATEGVEVTGPDAGGLLVALPVGTSAITLRPAGPVHEAPTDEAVPTPAAERGAAGDRRSERAAGAAPVQPARAPLPVTGAGATLTALLCFAAAARLRRRQGT